MHIFNRAGSLAALAFLAACQKGEPQPRTEGAPTATAAAPAPTPTAAAVAAGFNPATAPLANPKLGAWPYFGLIDGYTPMTRETDPGDSQKEYLRDANFDEYEVFDGSKLIRLEGRLSTRRANGSGASFFEVKKTYERLVQDQGGVTVWEGSGKVMEDAKLAFSAGRHRGYNLGGDQMGVYMLRAPDRQIWVEVYKPWVRDDENYWVTVVEVKTMELRAAVLPAAEMKRALDAAGRVALQVNFDTDKTTIRPESAPLVAEIAALMKANPDLSIWVDGHTDNTGDAARNMVLSVGRAKAVVAALLAQGIAADRLTPRGFGAGKPVASNDTEEGKANNRRVELVKK